MELNTLCIHVNYNLEKYILVHNAQVSPRKLKRSSFMEVAQSEKLKLENFQRSFSHQPASLLSSLVLSLSITFASQTPHCKISISCYLIHKQNYQGEKRESQNTYPHKHDFSVTGSSEKILR